MPLSKNEQTNQTAAQLVDTFRGVFHTPETDRPAHARGQFVKGKFTPTDAGSSLSTAKIFAGAPTPIVARLSSATGIPTIGDDNASSNPRGFAIRFLLSKDGHTHYDLIFQSANGFIVRTGEELLAFFAANKAGTTEEFFAKYPHAKEFGSKSPGFPKSFATEQFFGVNAFKLTNSEGKETFIRYRVVPADEEVAHYTQDEVDGKGKDYLYNELRSRFGRDSGAVRFKLLAQIAEPEDPTDDATKVWPETRKLVELGIIQLDELWDAGSGDDKEQKRIIFDPVPRHIDGIEASADPMLDMRATVYLISGKKRRAANGVA